MKKESIIKARVEKPLYDVVKKEAEIKHITVSEYIRRLLVLKFKNKQ